jgi:rhamnosyltransferase
LSEDQKDLGTQHRSADEGPRRELEAIRRELEAVKKAFRDKEAELASLQQEATARQNSLIAEIGKWKAACSEYYADAERLRRWRRVRQRIAPEGSLRHFVLGLVAAWTKAITGKRNNDVTADLRDMGLLLRCEEPNIGASPKLSGFTRVSGWASPKRKVLSIGILIDGAHVGNAFYGFVRPDVIRSHPEFGHDVHVGFAFRLDTKKLSAGIHSLKVMATAKDGEIATQEGYFEVLAEQMSGSEYAEERQNAPLEITMEISRNVTEGSVNAAGEQVQASVVIFARNQAEFLSRSLPVIVNQKTSFKFDVIGFDTESDDGTPHVFRRHGVRVVPVRKDEFHHMRTRLQSLREARSPLVVFLVGDALPADDHWLEALVWPLIEDPQVAATYSRQLPAPGCVPWEARDIYLGCSVVREVKQVNWSLPPEVENYRKNQWKFISFSDVSACYRRELLESLPIPEALPEVEDQYWCKCLLEAGYSIVLEPTSLVIHSHNHSLRQLYRRQVRFGRCFATFMDVPPQSARRLLSEAAQDAMNDFFYIAGCEANWFRKGNWVLQAPLMRLVKRYGLYEGFRLGGFRVEQLDCRDLAQGKETTEAVPAERSK